MVKWSEEELCNIRKAVENGPPFVTKDYLHLFPSRTKKQIRLALRKHYSTRQGKCGCGRDLPNPNPCNYKTCITCRDGVKSLRKYYHCQGKCRCGKKPPHDYKTCTTCRERNKRAKDKRERNNLRALKKISMVSVLTPHFLAVLGKTVNYTPDKFVLGKTLKLAIFVSAGFKTEDLDDKLMGHHLTHTLQFLQRSGMAKTIRRGVWGLTKAGAEAARSGGVATKASKTQISEIPTVPVTLATRSQQGCPSWYLLASKLAKFCGSLPL